MATVKVNFEPSRNSYKDGNIVGVIKCFCIFRHLPIISNPFLSMVTGVQFPYISENSTTRKFLTTLD